MFNAKFGSSCTTRAMAPAVSSNAVTEAATQQTTCESLLFCSFLVCESAEKAGHNLLYHKSCHSCRAAVTAAARFLQLCYTKYITAPTARICFSSCTVAYRCTHAGHVAHMLCSQRNSPLSCTIVVSVADFLQPICLLQTPVWPSISNHTK